MPLDFPSSPTNGQVYGNYYYNSARGAWNALLPAATPNFFTNATLNTSTLVDATATASAISTVPLIINGLSGQTANIQEWKSNGVLNAFVNSYGGAKFVDLKINTSSSLGSLGIIPGLASQVGVVVRGTASQTANLQEWQNSSGTAVSYIAAGGSIYSPTGSQMGSSYNVFQNSAAVHPVVVVKGYASQTADLQQWQSSTGAVLSEINSAGELQVPRIGVGSIMPTTTQLHVTSAAAANIGLVVQGAASQTANLQEWKSSAGISMSRIASNGSVNVEGNGTHARFYGVNSAVGSDQYNFLLVGGNDTGTKAVHFINSSTRTADGGANAYTIRNDGGPFNLGSSSFTTTINGLVSRPNQVSFQATKTDAHATASQYLVFNNVIHNTGNAYNSSNGRFTAPVAGRYLINFSTLLWNMGSASNVYLFVNSSQQQFMGTYGQFTGSYAGQGASAVVNLNTNDYVQLYFTHNGTNLHSGYTVASGYFLG